MSSMSVNPCARNDDSLRTGDGAASGWSDAVIPMPRRSPRVRNRRVRDPLRPGPQRWHTCTAYVLGSTTRVQRDVLTAVLATTVTTREGAHLPVSPQAQRGQSPRHTGDQPGSRRKRKGERNALPLLATPRRGPGGQAAVISTRRGRTLSALRAVTLRTPASSVAVT